MDYLKELEAISNENVNFCVMQLRFKPPRICGTCPVEQSSDIIVDTLHLEIESPKKWDELSVLLDKSNFKFNEEDHVSKKIIHIEKSYNKFDKYAFYKKPGFDEVFTAMKVMKPNLTEYDFIFTCGLNIDGMDTVDTDLVTEDIYHGDERCIRMNDGTIYTEDKVDETCFTVRYVYLFVPVKDIELNFELLTKIILTQK